MQDRTRSEESDASLPACRDVELENDGELEDDGRKRGIRNPLLVILMITGFAFCLTAWLTYLAALRELDPASAGGGESGLMAFVSRWGISVLLVELAMLVSLAMAAIASDRRHV